MVLWYNQCAFDDMSEDGSFTGGINVVLTPNDSSSQSGTAVVENQRLHNKNPCKKASLW
jgi:hypothetical protein